MPPPEVFRPREGRALRGPGFGMSRLATQLIALMLGGLALLLVGTLYAADLRRGAVDTVTRSLLVQSDVLAANLAGATDPEDGAPLLTVVAGSSTDAQAGTAARPADAGTPRTEIRRTATLNRLARTLEGASARVRIFGIDGKWLTDTSMARENQTADSGGLVARPVPAQSRAGPIEAAWAAVARLLLTPDLPPEPADPAPPAALSELGGALGGVKTAVRRLDSNGMLLISVATPIIDNNGQVVGVLHLRSPVGSVDELAQAQELAIVRVFLIAAFAAIGLCFLIAATIARPIRSLARAADRIRAGGVSTPMPELRDRGEVGELSRVLHDMTEALYLRIDSIEAFAGEVAHELKNPLTSLRSAVETLPLARTEKARDQLLGVILHDVQRIDRLISDISDASKLDAELNRHRYRRFDLVKLLETIVDSQAEQASDRGQMVELIVHGEPDDHAYQISGNNSRLSQVFVNLLDNARSFTPDGGRVVVTAERFSSFVEVIVEDEGPGIPEDALERIFERFYTDRSDQNSFGNNSGLGLAISRQIVEAHGGEIFADNRYRTTLGPDRDVAGARFTVRLPAAT